MVQKAETKNLTVLALAAVSALLLASCGDEPGGTAGDGKPAKLAAEAKGKLMVDQGPVRVRSRVGSYLAGKHAEATNDFAAAADFYSRLLEADPKNRSLLSRTLLLTLSDGRTKEATQLAERLLKTDPDNSMARMTLAVAAAGAGRYDTAETHFRKLPRQGLTDIIVPMALAWARFGQGKKDEAIKSLLEEKEKHGYKTFYDLHLAMMYDLKGDAAKAEESFKEASGASARPPARLIAAFASFYSRQGKTPEAIDQIETYLRNNPRSDLLQELKRQLAAGKKLDPTITSGRDGMAEAIFDLASVFFRENAHNRALIYGRLALMARPNLDIALMLVAEVQASHERYAEAAAVLKQIDKDSPLDWSARLRLAETLERLERPDAAVKELEKLASERKASPDPLIQMGDTLRQKEEFKEAVKAYDRAFERVEKLGESSAKHRWTLYYSRGIALERAKLWERAEKDFLKALELEPDQPYVLNYLGYSWVEKGLNLDKARGMIEKAVAQRPDDGYIVDSLGWVLYRLGKFGEAVEPLEKAVELRPHDPVINDHLGDAYWRVGRFHEARYQWSRALSLKPDKELIPAIEKKLKRGLEAAAPVKEKKKSIQ